MAVIVTGLVVRMAPLSVQAAAVSAHRRAETEKNTGDYDPVIHVPAHLAAQHVVRQSHVILRNSASTHLLIRVVWKARD
ncbi:hypothetical protein [Methylibium petroleiphilum]|uniref:hypothetical protein n=1 Tax=Methylibium petroleiphilum TaxID=105560 RepID=UPI003D26BB5F